MPFGKFRSSAPYQSEGSRMTRRPFAPLAVAAVAAVAAGNLLAWLTGWTWPA
jgi:hypothetical protein